MLKRYRFTLFFLLFILISPFLLVTTTTACEILFNNLKEAGHSPIKQTLTGGNTEYFTFNVIVPYKNQNEDSFVITMTIQDALIYGNTLGELSNFGTIVCTANDSSILPESLNGNIPFGSQTWIQSQNKVSNTLIVEFIDNTNSNFIKIIPGTKGYITPEYLLKLVRTAIESEDHPYTLLSHSHTQSAGFCL